MLKDRRNFALVVGKADELASERHPERLCEIFSPPGNAEEMGRQRLSWSGERLRERGAILDFFVHVRLQKVRLVRALHRL